MHSNPLIFSALQTVGPKAGSAAAAQAQETAPAGGTAPAPAQSQSAPSFGMAFLLPLLILVPFFFFSSRRQKKEQAERAKMKRGDRVVATSGLIGELVELDDRFAKVKLAPGITVQMLASSLGPLDTAAAAETAASTKSQDKDALKDLKEAKVAAEKSAPAK